ncbi:MAG: sucrase ferredoxin [Myxococcota bacterium]
MNPCSNASVAAHESMVGTAADQTLHWVGVEVRGPWKPKAITDNSLPPSVQAWLLRMKARPNTRPVFLRRRNRRAQMAVQYANVETGRVHMFEVERHEDILHLPWDGLFAGTTDVGLTDQEPVWVCAHGNRDHCCGLHGPAFARALEQIAPGRAWLCTHLGGHRFAATAVALPTGAHFGRLRSDDAANLVEALHTGVLHNLHKYRGNVRYPPFVQAAEAHIRAREALMNIDAKIVLEWAMDEDNGRVRVQSHHGERWLRVSSVRVEPLTPSSCGAAPTPLRTWHITPEP